MGLGMQGAQAAFDQAYPRGELESIHRDGGLLRSIKLRWAEYRMIFYINGEWMQMALSMVLLGYAAGRSGVVNSLFREPRRFLVPGCVFMLAGLAGFPTYATTYDGPIYYVIGVGLLLSTFAMIWLVAMFCKTPPGGYLMKALAPVGRQSLTTYMGGAAIFAVVFHHYGWGLYATLEYPEPTYIALATFVALGVFAHLWQGRFSQGPLEWLWRTLTYRSSIRRGPRTRSYE